MNFVLVVIGFFCFFVLFWDFYVFCENIFSLLVLFCIIFWGIGMVCIILSFSIVFLIFIEMMKILLGFVCFKNLLFLMLIMLLNILYLLLLDLVVWFYFEVRVMVFICYVIFVIWGLVVFIGYFVVGI